MPNRNARQWPATGTAQTVSDSESIGGDPVALGMELEACRPYLLTMANQEIAPALRPKEGASDIVQETLFEAYQDLPQFAGRTRSDLRGWLRRILRNNLSNFARRYRACAKRAVTREVSLDVGDPGALDPNALASRSPSPSGQAILGEQSAWLKAALGRLKERDRLVLTWRAYDHCDWKEIGRRIGGSEEKARKVWTRALERLRAQTDGQG